MRPGNEPHVPSPESPPWEPTACILCECNCGIQVQLGGDGQGNHLPGFYARSTLRSLGSVFRSNALAQEKTGEMWVAQQMVGAPSRGDFHHCEVGVFLGKNPWQSHGIPRARVTLRELAKDPERCLIVIDVRRTETADLADIFLQVKPGTDAWLLAAMLGVLLEENLTDREFIARHTDGFEQVRPVVEQLDIAAACAACGVSENLVRTATRRIAAASSVAVFEDLGVQMNRNSTLVSYLQRLVWMLTGNFGKHGAQNIPTALVPITAGRSAGPRSTPVTLSPNDAATLELTDGDRARLVTPQGSAEVLTRVSDPIAGTPWHKSVPARLERLTDAAA